MIELWERVEAEWNKILQQVCMDLVENMPRRIAAVLKAKGGYTKYLKKVLFFLPEHHPQNCCNDMEILKHP